MKVALQFVGMGVVWGASFFLIKIALDGVSFTQVAWARLVLGALTLGIIALATRSSLPREPIVWFHFVVVALTYCVFPFLLFAWGEQFVSSSLASIYDAATPITTAIFATAVFRVERLHRDQVLGVVVGLVGVLGTGIAYIWNMNVLRVWGPTATSGVTYLVPVVGGVGLGVLLLGDRLTWNEPVGVAVVIVGIVLTQQRLRIINRAAGSA